LSVNHYLNYVASPCFVWYAVNLNAEVIFWWGRGVRRLLR